MSYCKSNLNVSCEQLVGLLHSLKLWKYSFLVFVPGKKSDRCPNDELILFKWFTVNWSSRTLQHVCNTLICVCSRIGENLEQSLPSLTELVLTSNNIQELVSAFWQQSL